MFISSQNAGKQKVEIIVSSLPLFFFFNTTTSIEVAGQVVFQVTSGDYNHGLDMIG